MIFFNLQLTSNESIFKYLFFQEFLDKEYEIGLLKLNDILKIISKINVNHTKNKFYYIVNTNCKN